VVRSPHYLPHFPRAPAQPAESVPAVPRYPPKTQPGEVTTLAEKGRYIGHIVSTEDINIDVNKLKALQEWPTPKNKHEISFLSLCTYYRRFTSGFANIAKPLTKLTEQKQSFQ
jgi:hypothetical protein